MAPVLGYWKIRGIAEPIRLVLIYTGIKYKEELFECGQFPDYDRSCWFDIKETCHGLDFPNLPYYLDGQVKLTQSDAILKYLARKYNLGGITEKETIRVDLIHHQILDYRNDFARTCYSHNYEEERDTYIIGLPLKLERLSLFLANRKYVTGENITYVDFMLYEFLKRNRAMLPQCLDKFLNLRDFFDRIEALPQINEYLKSPSSSANYAMHNKFAKFGSRPGY